MGKVKHDWEAIKTEYVTTKISQRNLADKYGVSFRQISRMCANEKWVEARRKFVSDMTAKTIEKIEKDQANHLARLITATTKAVDVAMEAFEDEKQFNRYIITEGLGQGETETDEKVFQKFDTKALKDLMGVIKDATSLLREFYNIPTPAQAEAQRIAAARLALEQEKTEKDSTTQHGSIEIIGLPEEFKR